MTTIEIDRPRPSRRNGLAAGIVGGTLRRVRHAYRLGGRTLVVAPALAALAILPEFAQHVAEVQLGMYASTAAFRALSDDPTRWAFGYVKVAGFLLAILLTARFWGLGGDRRALLRPGWTAVRRAAVGLALGFGSGALFDAVRGQGAATDAPLTALNAACQVVFTVYLVGALLGDGRASLRWCLVLGWPRALFMTLLIVLAFAPCQLLHMLHHKVAIGAGLPVVWTMMVWDSLFLGLFAALVGSAAAVGYRYGPSWRGWDEPLPAERG